MSDILPTAKFTLEDLSKKFLEEYNLNLINGLKKYIGFPHDLLKVKKLLENIVPDELSRLATVLKNECGVSGVFIKKILSSLQKQYVVEVEAQALNLVPLPNYSKSSPSLRNAITKSHNIER